MRRVLLLTAALALGCGSAQHATGPEALTEGFPPPAPWQQRPGKGGKCRQPGWGADVEILVANGGCWTPLDATPEQCERAHRENPYHVLYRGRCWYPLPGGNGERQPTSSLLRGGRP